MSATECSSAPLVIRRGWAPTTVERLLATPRRTLDDVVAYADATEPAR